MYSLKTTYNIKSRLHSRQQPCHSPRQTVIGLRNLFSKRLLAIPYSAVLQKISIFENTALVRVSAHVYTQVCFANLELNRTRYFSVQFKLGLSGSASVPLPRVPPFLCYYTLLSRVYISDALALPP